MKKTFSLILMFFVLSISFAQQREYLEENLSIDKFTDGTLTLPENIENPSLVIFIQGSGPTNRDGNQPMMKNDGIKKIAHELANKGIASFRYDKRIFKMDKLRIKEADLSFEDFVTDLNSIIEHFSKENKYKNLILAGHSEGSLIGMLAAQSGGADAFISLAGAGRSIDEIIVEQLAKQSAELSENARSAFEEIKEKGRTSNYSPYLESIFRPSVQPYIKSWMKFDPAAELAKLDIPVLIVNGSFDLQVDVTDARLLQNAAAGSQLVIPEKMNHIFRKIEGESLENTKAYNEPGRPLHPELIPSLVDFINSIE
ncbi:lysophospholipase [Antarcticibacterium arcticum]|uniref:Lysophospholipase n=1 Tax=Antarcticibacterium arcticum TaxID=2585771 RepID=A0A5B8YI89_9FLAO|nr:alpha/beta hydrolase [Antarcticibacterium arcticum]QED37642.1 lysophospholipase [Antarcticibacterium arcticum]